MKRRDFITKSTLGVTTASALLSSIDAEGVNKAPQESPGLTEQSQPQRLSSDDGGKEVMHYSQKPRSGVVIGGIGAGGAEVRKDGVFYNWSIVNNAPKGTGRFFSRAPGLDKDGFTSSLYPNQDDEVLFFVVRYKEEGKNPAMKLLQIVNEGYQNAGLDREQFIYYFPWMSCVETIEYTARFPFAVLNFKDPEMPFEVEMKSWAPFIPHDVKNSSLPGMYFDFKIKSLSKTPVEVMIMASYRNLAGYDTDEKVWTSEVINKDKYKYSVSGAGGMDAKASSFGSMAMASLSPESTFNMPWAHRHVHYEQALLSNTLRNRNKVEDLNFLKNTKGEPKGSARNFSTWGQSTVLNVGDTSNHSFILGWDFPNLYDDENKFITGHYYSNFFTNSKQVIEYLVENKEDLYKKTMAFVNSFYESTVPSYLLNMVNSQLTTFITSTQLSKKMEFGVIEGITHHQDWGPVGTTDVNMYGGVMISALFPELQKSTMRVHKAIQHPGGEIRHSFKKGFAQAILNLPVNAAGAVASERLDLPAQYVIMVLRDFFWSNDKAYLQEMWPSVKNALHYVLKERDKNGDQQPDMEGIMCTYDNFPMYGMSSLIQSQWMCAISGALQAAEVMGDKGFIQTYTPVLEKGKKLADEKLWNGSYYILYNSDLKTQKVKDGAGKEVVKDLSGKDEGCLTDQIIGQWAAHMSDLGELFPSDKRKKTLQSILKMSYIPSFGLRNCSWPSNTFITPVAEDIWVDQANTCWSGVELGFASFLLYEGLYEEALKVVQTVDQRYRKAGLYFDHQEFGGHYFRPMGAWGIMNGLLGLSVNQETYGFSPKVPEKNFKLFFAFADGTANVESKDGKVVVNVLTGNWKVKKVKLKDFNIGEKAVKASTGGKSIGNGKVENGLLVVDFKKTITVPAGQSLVIG